MHPRVLLRSHRDVNHPGIFSALLALCTSLDDSATVDQVAERLRRVLKDSSHPIGEAGAEFAVRLARQMGFLTSHQAWDAKGLALAGVSDWQIREVERNALFDISLEQRLLYLRYFLLANGALLLGFCREIAENDYIEPSGFLKKGCLEQVLAEIWRFYLGRAAERSEQAKLRQKISFFTGSGYDPGTRPHKFFPHVEILIALGILSQDVADGVAVYRSRRTDSYQWAHRLVSEIPDLSTLESLASGLKLLDAIVSVLDLKPELFDQRIHLQPFLSTLVSVHERITHPVTRLSPIEALRDATVTLLLGKSAIFLKPSTFRDLVVSLQEMMPRGIRFVTDRTNTITHVMLSEELGQRFVNTD